MFEIRKDLESASQFLIRLYLYSEVFRKNNIEKWPHLKYREDFHNIDDLEFEHRRALDRIYMEGRDLSVHMSHKLLLFNYPEECPTLTSYVKSFSEGYLSKIDDLTETSNKAKETYKAISPSLWSVREMIKLFDEQIDLLGSIKETLRILEKTDLYKIENGEVLMKEERGNTNIHVSNSNAKISIDSQDNSVNQTISKTEDLFFNIRQAITSSEISTEERESILNNLDELEKLKGENGFAQKYKDFIQLSANHMSIIAPFIPALTSLI